MLFLVLALFAQTMDPNMPGMSMKGMPMSNEATKDSISKETPTMAAARKTEAQFRADTVALCKRKGLTRCYTEFSSTQSLTGKPVYVLVCKINNVWRSSNCPLK